MKITICIGSSCHIKGSRQVVEIINVNGSNVQINTENYNNGIYFVRVLTSDANVTVKKVVVSK